LFDFFGIFIFKRIARLSVLILIIVGLIKQIQ